MDTSLSAPLIFLDQDDLITGWSEGAKRLLGWDTSRVIGEPFSEIYDERGFFIGADGPVDLDSVSVPTPDQGRVIALRNTRTTHLLERLDLTMTNADVIGAWNWDVAGELIFTDSRFASTFGVDAHKAEHGLPLQEFIDRIHEEDRARVAAEMVRTIESGGAYAAEYRMLRPGGDVRHVLAQGKLVEAEDGQPARFPGVLFDVTARRQAEMEAQAQKERFRTLFENLESGFCIIRMIWDEAGKPVDYEFIEVNRAFARHTGIKDAVGKRMRRDVAADHEQYWFDLYGKVARSGEPVSIEYPAEALGRWFQVQAFSIDSPGSDIGRRAVQRHHRQQAGGDVAQGQRGGIPHPGAVDAQPCLDRDAGTGMIDWLNDQVVAFSGEAREKLYGNGWSAIVHPEDFSRRGRGLGRTPSPTARDLPDRIPHPPS